MMIFLLYFLSVIIIVLGFGLTIKKFLIKENFIESLGIGETGILGYYFLLLISLFFHFFISLNNYFVVCVYLLGFILFFLFRNYLEFFCLWFHVDYFLNTILFKFFDHIYQLF